MKAKGFSGQANDSRGQAKSSGGFDGAHKINEIDENSIVEQIKLDS